MGRPLRIDLGGHVYHVLNRSNARMTIFDDDDDYAAFEKILAEAQQRTDMRIIAWCLMPNHWHMVLWPRHDGDLSAFAGWVSLTHTQRWHAHRGTAGQGHVYQGRYKSFLIQSDEHLLTVCRYVERNPRRAGLVERAEDWLWSSLWLRANRRQDCDDVPVLSAGPVARPRNWASLVNQPQSSEELAALRQCVTRGRPFGRDAWVTRTAERFGITTALRPRGRPRITPPPAERHKGS